MKKVLVALLALCLVIVAIPIDVFAQSDNIQIGRSDAQTANVESGRETTVFEDSATSDSASLIGDDQL